MTLDGTDLVLPPTPVDNPFRTFVNYGTIQLNWEFSNAGGLGATPAGVSANELYVTLDTPDPDSGPAYHTLMYISVPGAAAMAADTPEMVIAAIWEKFQTKALTTKHVLGVENGKPLTYYKQWDATATNEAQILNATTNPNRDGKCGAFAELFVYAIRKQVAKVTRPINALSVGPKVALEGILINNWDFIGPGTGGDYPYVNTFQDPTINPANNLGIGSFIRNNNGVWEYYWALTRDVADLPGVAGQNTANPKSNFSDHMVVEIGGKIYDPSYGTGPFDNRRAWEEASVAGFNKFDQISPNNWRMILRQNLAAVEDIKVLETQAV